jgi:hypothetical protein
MSCCYKELSLIDYNQVGAEGGYLGLQFNGLRDPFHD